MTQHRSQQRDNSIRQTEPESPPNAAVSHDEANQAATQSAEAQQGAAQDTQAAPTPPPEPSSNALVTQDESGQSPIDIAATVQQNLKETKDLWVEIKNQKVVINWVQTVTYLGFVIILLMVAAMVANAWTTSGQQSAQLQKIIDQTAPTAANRH